MCKQPQNQEKRKRNFIKVGVLTSFAHI